MNDLVFPRERTLGLLTLILGLLGWTLLILGTFGAALIVMLLGLLAYLFAQSALIAYIKGNGVELSEQQFPELYAQFAACCDRLGLKNRPQAYILNGDGGLNAFATKFLGTEFVVLYSAIVDAMDNNPDGVRFYIGHELGHLRMKHLTGQLLRWPVLWLPLLGAAYSRARESTCDRHGLACSTSPENAARALSALSAGSQRWQHLNLPAYVRQAHGSIGFWMSFHELVSGYPWLSKRSARVLDTAAADPSRHPLAYLFALFVPFAGRLGAGFGMLIMVYIIAVLAAVAIPAYKTYAQKPIIGAAMSSSATARTALADYYATNQAFPETLQGASIPDKLADGSRISIDPAEMVLTVTTPKDLQLVFTASLDEEDKLIWGCSAGENVMLNALPSECSQ